MLKFSGKNLFTIFIFIFIFALTAEKKHANSVFFSILWNHCTGVSDHKFEFSTKDLVKEWKRYNPLDGQKVYFRPFFESFQVPFREVLWGHIGLFSTKKGPKKGRKIGDFWVISDHVWVDPGSFWHRFDIIWGSFWCRFDPIMRPFWALSGPFFGPFCPF